MKAVSDGSWINIFYSRYAVPEMKRSRKGRQMVLRSTLRNTGRAKPVKQTINPDDYPIAYLVTSPRLLNYKFSPASFWFLYSKDRKLTAMIAEVNNTFDERRMYFLKEKHSGNCLQRINDMAPGAVNESEEFEKGYFRHAWPKDFHVSPFSSRKGSYVLKARDPTALIIQQPAGRKNLKEEIIDINASLLSSKGHVKLVTRLSSTGAPLDPIHMSPMEFLVFFSSWWWIGLMTCESLLPIAHLTLNVMWKDPRIVLQAIKLAHRRGLSIWYRPEVRPSAVPRRATSSEE